MGGHLCGLGEKTRWVMQATLNLQALLSAFFADVTMLVKTITVIVLLVCSNLLMTVAWYWHIKPGNAVLPMWKIILISWGIALFEYCLAVPANHYGASWGIKPFQLKIMQEVITLTTFALFAVVYLKEGLRLNYLISFGLILGAVYFAFKK